MWIFKIGFLATAIADALRKRSEGAPLSSRLQSSPSRTGILGVLDVCEKQTSAFNWNMLLHAVSKSVSKELESGTSALVVWAHHVLDLNVLVRPLERNGKPVPNVRFGHAGLEQVCIEEVAMEDEAAIILLDSSKEHLLSIRPEPDAEYNLIGAVKKIPARGWGNAVLQDTMSHLEISGTKVHALVKDLQIITSAFAFIVAKNLIKDESERIIGETDEEDIDTSELLLHEVDERRLLQASRYLFDDDRLSQSNINTYVTQYSCKPLDERLVQPPALEAAARAHPSENRDNIVEDEWNQICRCARELGVFLIALAHVSNLEGLDDLMISGVYFSDIFEHSLVQQLEE